MKRLLDTGSAVHYHLVARDSPARGRHLMTEHRCVIFTLHGIHSDGEWHKDIAEVLEPHFRCLPLPYSQFRHLGWLKIFNPFLRRRAVKTVAAKFSDQLAPWERPHLIAHSFGTWVAFQLMRLPSTRLGRVVFAASPLPADLNWEGELADNPEAFEDLTNEYSRKDAVAAIAGVASGAACADQVGFRGPPDRIHDTRAFRLSCPRCRDLPEKAQARIHNLEWRHFPHSGWFIGSGHFHNLWLPYFWGLPPEEYAAFIEICLRLADLESCGDLLNMGPVERDFRERAWTWTRWGQTALSLDDYVAANIGPVLTSLDLLPDQAAVSYIRTRAPRLVWQIVRDAIQERHRPGAERRENILRRLHPKFAVHTAIDVMARKYWTIGR